MLYLYIWIAVVIAVYFVITMDYVYYKYNLPKQCQKFYEALTEEE